MGLCRWAILVAATLCATSACLLGLTRQGLAGAAFDPRNAGELLHALPADVDAVVVVADAARQRTGGAGAALAELIGESKLFDDTVRAWRNLAAVLDWPADRAFDELLGRRVTVVIDGLADGEPFRWALLSEVTPAAEARLRERLKPAPRGIVAGLPVLAVEDGRYELAISRRKGTSLILLAQAGEASLFDRLVPVLSGRASGPLLGQSEAMKTAAELCAGDVFVLYRPPLERAGEAPGFAAVSATLNGDGWTARLISTPGVIWASSGADFSALEPWSDAAFEALSRDAMIATMGVLGQATPSWRTVLDGQLWTAPLGFADPGEMAKLLGQRGMFVVRATPAPPDARQRKQERPSERLSVVLGLETTDAAAMAVAGDRIIASVIPLLEAGCIGGEPGAPGPQYDGAMPEAVRIVTLEGEFAEAMGSAFGPTPVLSWGYCFAGGAAPPPLLMKLGAEPTKASAPCPGWWVMALSPADAPAALLGCQALEQAPADRDAAPRVSRGVIRPGMIERWMAEVDPTFLGPLRPFRWIDSVDWDARVRPDGTIAAEIEVRMGPSEPRRQE